MSTNKILLAGVVGGIVFFLFGFLFYGVLLMKFYADNVGSAQGVMKDPPVWWALIVGNLTWGIFLAIVFGRWAGIRTLATGARAGAIIGFLVSLSINLSIFATTNVSNLTSTLVDVVVTAVMSAITGAAVGWMLGRGKV